MTFEQKPDYHFSGEDLYFRSKILKFNFEKIATLSLCFKKDDAFETSYLLDYYENNDKTAFEKIKNIMIIEKITASEIADIIFLMDCLDTNNSEMKKIIENEFKNVNVNEMYFSFT